MNRFSAVLVALAVGGFAQPASAADPLPSWNEGKAKRAILDFTANVTKPGSADFVPPAERVAVFDNDGTLWCEQPVYAQFAFALHRVKAMFPDHPEWKGRQPFQGVLDGDLKAAFAGGEQAVLEVVTASHANTTTDEFPKLVTDWLAVAEHPKLKRRYTELVYQPMLEVLTHLRAAGFKTYIVSGGGVEFLRPWAEAVYGVPPEQVVGSGLETRYELRDGKPTLVRLPTIDFIDDKAGKPVGIHTHIGRRPVMAFGNSDGDYEMLHWTTSGPGPRFGLIVHHTDADREFAYDRKSAAGRLSKALDDAPKHGWVVADMKADWKVVFPAAK